MKAIIKIFLFVFSIALVSTACVVPFGPRLVRGSGDVIIEERKVSGFDEILVTGAGKVIVTQGSSETLSIETDDNLMEYIETNVRGNTLEIGFTDNTVFSKGGGGRALDPTDGFIFRVGVVNLNAISVSGAARFEIEKIKTDQLAINLSGAGDVMVDDLNATQLTVGVSGAGDVAIAGKVEIQHVVMSGFGRYRADDLESQEGSVTISGAGGADVWVTENLDVTISGAGDVKYYGNPSVDPEISGVGRIQSQGEK